MSSTPSPPGYDPKWSLTSAFMSPQRAEPSQDWLTPQGALRQDLAMDHNPAQFEAGALKFAQGQAGTLFQTLFFMWMIGTQLSLFSMIFLMQGGFTPFLSILRINQAFAPFSLPGVNTTLAKGIYFAIHAVGCFFICWKLKALGILPITSADWVQLIPARRFTDFSSS